MPPTARDYTVSLTARVLQAVFETDVNLSEFVPEPLQVRDLHHGLIKAYHLRLRQEPDPVQRPKYSRYRQVCVTVAAAPPDLPLRH